MGQRKKEKEGIIVKDTSAHEVDRVLEQHEFSCALVRLAVHRYYSVLVKEDMEGRMHPCCSTTSQAVSRYIAEIIVPWYEAAEASDTKEKEIKAELISKIAAPQLPKYAPKIKKLYKKVSQAGDAPGGHSEPGEGSVDCAEFLIF